MTRAAQVQEGAFQELERSVVSRLRSAVQTVGSDPEKIFDWDSGFDILDIALYDFKPGHGK